MLIIKNTIETTATPSQIWHIWQDIATWNTWDHDLEFSTLNGPFTTGTTGTLKFKTGPLLQTKLAKVEPMHLFVQEANVPLARFVMSHFVTERNGKSTVTFKTEIRGPLALFWALLMGKGIKKKIPIEMAAMIKKAEKQS
ncbi:SRPBCC family protein [Candidatus Babeliales bacterium]|nr:SRPBCC family protein [Candidatus Babeliales bacterium]